uniref:hypothetical protein n=1 Tax=Burkholderia pseudomallei TaxID=28450 RepID=UPI0012671EDB|nr:hypothetical protein [Burkholderia pseudomallei]
MTTITRTQQPAWLAKALQGVAFWIGHRQSLYSAYPLTEAAIVTEVCNLIHANLGDGYRLKCEVPFSKFIADEVRPDLVTERARVDLVVAKRVKQDGKTRLKVKYLIEVKRASAPKTQIDADLRRLAAVKKVRPSSRAFLLVISEGTIPTGFVSKRGMSLPGKKAISGSDGFYRVLKTFKAAKFFSRPSTAHYACLVEVFANPLPRETNF